MNKTNSIFILIILLIAGCSSELPKESQRTINQGEMIGIESDNNTFAWLGIPFAEPPVGNLRWKAPLQPKAFNLKFEANQFADACFQPGGLFGGGEDWMGSEDCLYLNVWTPAWSTEELKEKNVPVMVWIHGGGNTTGSTDTYNPSNMVFDNEVIVVTVQYRMSNLGWFRHPSLRQGNTTLEDASGSFGTLDNIMALRWVKDNISVFGGDVNNVTIYGESAGGHNVAALYASPLAEGLFHKAIVQSGIVSHSDLVEAESYYPESGVSGIQSSKEVLNWLLLNDDKATTLLEARNMQDLMSLQESEDYLRSKTPEELLTAYRNVRPKKGGMTRAFNDGHVLGEEGIIESFTNQKMSRVPIILGTNRYESKLFNMRNPRFVRWGKGEGIVATAASWAGIEELPLEIMNPDFYNAVNQYAADSWKERAADTPASQLVASGHANTYVYRFDWDDLPVINGMDFGVLAGAAHALELLFLFPAAFDNILIKNLVIKDSYDGAIQLSDQMMSYWAEFAYTGDPGMGRSKDLPQWNSWSGQYKYMILDSEEGQGLTMVNTAVTVNSMVDEMAEDQRLTADEKCQTLFTMAYGGDFPQEKFDAFNKGYCLTLDYSDILEIMERRGDDDDQDS
jgi:para-nitrobenzyl esterase